MAILLLVIGFILFSIIWLFIELVTASSFNAFLDEKIMRRTKWLWVPIYALWRMFKEVIFNNKK
ncbi:MAG: hypothetical protein UT50_C0002G0038 [Candidatus Moranbacteria bacterium GW2011_GWA2_39_41]|nr:MAG: hypothetical protein UT50_C0002G0038 [Candidatus Moranbacteria bacterium GW2011_GWA2_39_41]